MQLQVMLIDPVLHSRAFVNDIDIIILILSPFVFQYISLFKYHLSDRFENL